MRFILLAAIALAGCGAPKAPPPDFSVSVVKHASVPPECKRNAKARPKLKAQDYDGAKSFDVFTRTTDQYDSEAARWNACNAYYQRELGEK